MKFSIIRLLPFLLFCFAMSVLPALGEDDTVERSLGIVGNNEEMHTLRTPRPQSLIAENVTVVTAEEIARLNAHTLDEVLQTISGFQFLQVRTPGSAGVFFLDGSMSIHVLILIDGVPQNLLGVDLFSEFSTIPVQRIERIEIIKGAASVAWGAALGGVVNIITREPVKGAKLGGTASASYGEGSTSDLQGGVSGTVGRLGYYLDGGSFNSRSLLPANRATLDHAFGKLTYDLPGKGRLTFGTDYRDLDRSLGYGDKARGMGDNRITEGSRFASAYLLFDYQLHDRLDLEILTSATRKDNSQKYVQPGPLLIFDAQNQTDSQQASAKLTWGNRTDKLIAGFEYLNDDIRVSEPQTRFPFVNFTRDLDRFGVYLNGSYALGPVTLLPGARFDLVGNKKVSSYHLGATWQLTDKTLIRVYAARGYSLPMPNFKDSLQNIWTVQTGFESSAIPFLWLKGTLYYSNTWNIQNYVVPPDYPSSPVATVISEETRKGFEIEGRTSPWHDLSFAAGFNYNDVRENKTGTIMLIPLNVTKLSLNYANATYGLSGMLVGSHVNWPSRAGNSVHDRQIVWDLHLTQKLAKYGSVTPEIFFSGRNLFNNAQYIDNFRTNTPSWFEGGMRMSF